MGGPEIAVALFDGWRSRFGNACRVVQIGP